MDSCFNCEIYSQKVFFLKLSRGEFGQCWIYMTPEESLWCSVILVFEI